MHRLVHLLETGRVPIRSCPVLTVVEVEATVISTNKRSKVTNLQNCTEKIPRCYVRDPLKQFCFSILKFWNKYNIDAQ